MKEYSLAISINKIKELKKNKGGVVSHHASQRWENFYNKRKDKVRFFDTVFHDECTCIVVDVKKTHQLGEPTIKIEVKL